MYNNYNTLYGKALLPNPPSYALSPKLNNNDNYAFSTILNYLNAYK